MMYVDELSWFAVQTQPGQELTAETALRLLQVDTLFPRVRRLLRHARRRPVWIRRAFFPGYLFARFQAAYLLRAVAYSPGVIRVLGTREGPQAVPEVIIDGIRERMGPDDCITLGDRTLHPGDPVRIVAGALNGWTGVFDRELSDAGRIAILIDTLQRSCRVVVARQDLEKIGTI